MKKTTSTFPKPVLTKQSNGTLNRPKQTTRDVSKGTKALPSGLVSKGESNAKLGKGGKATC